MSNQNESGVKLEEIPPVISKNESNPQLEQKEPSEPNLNTQNEEIQSSKEDGLAIESKEALAMESKFEN